MSSAYSVRPCPRLLRQSGFTVFSRDVLPSVRRWPQPFELLCRHAHRAGVTRRATQVRDRADAPAVRDPPVSLSSYSWMTLELLFSTLVALRNTLPSARR
jgi:hypothetical protein